MIDPSESEVPEMEQTLGKRIVHNRKRLGLTQDALAERLGVTPQAVSKWENDQSCPDIAMLPRLAEIFGITTDSLLGLEAPAKEAEVVTEDVPGLHIDKNDDHWEFKWDAGRKNYIGMAMWIISAALMLLAANFLDQQVSLWTALWTTGLTIFGILGLWCGSGILRLGCGLAGVYFIAGELWPRMFVLEKSYILPIFLLLFGLSLLTKAGKKKKKPSFHITSHGKDKRHSEYEVEGEEFHCELSFGSRNQPVELPRLREGEAEVSFGELTLDLRGCGEFAPGCHLELDCSFGELTVLLPASVRAETSSSTAFGDFTVCGQPNPDAANLILVDASANFGEITLRYI
jgi:transcriptional regulator with XRE-family HTH domain